MAPRRCGDRHAPRPRSGAPEAALGFTQSSGYGYDAAGNLTSDSGKGLTITNNQVNLPGIVQGSEGTLRYYITYGGERIATWGLGTKRHYLGEAEYKDEEIQHIAIPNGRLNLTGDEPQWEYHLTDHLGNIVVYFSDTDGDGEIATEEETMAANGDAEVLQRNHYYPFGLRVDAPVFQSLGDPVNRYLYNGKEIQGEGDLEIGWLYYGARMYDAEIGRFTGIDPLADSYAAYTPYHYVLGNPLRFVDPDGMRVESTIVRENDNGSYTVVGGDPNDGDNGVYVLGSLGQLNMKKIGDSLTPWSFFKEDGTAMVGANIDLSSDEFNRMFESYSNINPDIISYMMNATGGGLFDFKTWGIENIHPDDRDSYKYRGGMFKNKIVSARDMGNYVAGFAAARFGLAPEQARFGFDALETYQSSYDVPARPRKTFPPGVLSPGSLSGTAGSTATLYPKGWVEEGQPTQQAQMKGMLDGRNQFWRDLINLQPK